MQLVMHSDTVMIFSRSLSDSLLCGAHFLQWTPEVWAEANDLPTSDSFELLFLGEKPLKCFILVENSTLQVGLY